MNTQINIPDEFYCPITFEIMKDPVIGPDGHTYEKSAIQTWLQTNNTSPITRKPLHTTSLIPNIALKNVIETFLKDNNVSNLKKIVVPLSDSTLNEFTNELVSIGYNVSKTKLTSGKTLVNISINPPSTPKSGKSRPTTFVAVIDVSGSMDEEVSVNTETGTESHGFSRLDLVKHAMNTIIDCLNEYDNLVIITFSDSAKVLMDVTQMTSTGRTSSHTIVNSMRTEGSTNIWDGLDKALQITNNNSFKESNTVISLFTDGIPNRNPARGIIDTLKRAIKMQGLNTSINTFGFGYQLDSKLLSDIATEGNGIYGYIPDSSFVGTIFVNFVSNVMSSFTNRTTINVKPLNGAKITNTYGHKVYEHDEQFVFDIGSVQYGQKRDIIFEVDSTIDNEILDVSVDYNGKTTNTKISNIDNGNEHELMVQYYRQRFSSLITSCMNKFNLTRTLAESINDLQEFYKEVATSFVNTDGRIIAMLKDIRSVDENEGQIGKSFSRQDWYDKWGKHYVPSVSKAHQFQQCLNFKDPGMQLYGGTLFSNIQDKAEKVFMDTTPPTPSRSRHYSSYNSAAVSSQPVNMSQYYNSGGSCFDGNGVVQLQNGTTKLVKELCKGDIIMSGSNLSIIECVVRTNVHKTIDVININSMLITPWHPIKHSTNDWLFPIDIAKPEKHYLDYVYNFVVSGYQSVTVNGVECITLGHDMTGNVISHPYYGTQKVISDLKNLDGWENGFVVIDNFNLERDDKGMISKLVKHS
jgi:Mg-chelatase subunit ChlD